MLAQQSTCHHCSLVQGCYSLENLVPESGFHVILEGISSYRPNVANLHGDDK